MSDDHLILAHLQDKAEVEVLEDVWEEELDELVPNPFDLDTAATTDKDGDAEPVTEAGEVEALEEDDEEDEEEEEEEEEEEDKEEEEEEEEEVEKEEEGGATENEVGAGHGWESQELSSLGR
ncbi:unnamed protein product [Closterium sp. NIES-53]